VQIYIEVFDIRIIRCLGQEMKVWIACATITILEDGIRTSTSP